MFHLGGIVGKGRKTGRSQRAASPPGAGRILERWPLVVVAAVCLAVGGVVVERLTRPAEAPPIPPKPAPAEEAGLAFAPPAGPPVDLSGPKPTAGQLIAEATRLADQLAETHPGDPDALALAGQIYRAFGQGDKATACWKRGIERDPNLVAAHVGLGEIALERGEYEEAERHLRSAASLKPPHPGFHLRLAEAAMNLGRADEAVSLLQQAAQAGPLAPYDGFVLGQAYLLQGEHEKAKGQFESALAAEPRLAGAHYGLARALRALGRTAEAEKHAEQYASLKKHEMVAISRYRAMSFGKDLADQAVPPRVANFYLQSAERSAARGEAADAERQLLRAAGLCPQNPACWDALHAFYRRQGRDEKADAVARQWKSLQETLGKK